MRKKHYKFGEYNCYTYFTNAGKGYEIGFCWGKKTIFVGNFIHSKEAVQYWAFLNREIRSFGKKYWVGQNVSTTWYNKFFTNFLYTNYYKFLDTLFFKYQRTYTTHFRKDHNRYMKMKKNWTTTTKMKFKAAA